MADGLIIKVKVEPRSSRSCIVGPYGDGLKVKLTSPPVEGRANKELIELLASAYGVKKADVEIIAGHNSKNKIVALRGVRGIKNKKGLPHKITGRPGNP
jgi:hypothetical protein